MHTTVQCKYGGILEITCTFTAIRPRIYQYNEDNFQFQF